jgi:hypothetical protein
VPFVPEELHGRPVILARMVYAGDIAAGERAVAPFRALARPVADLIRPMKYPEMYPDEQGPRPAVVARTMFAGGVGVQQAETILERIGESSAMMAACEIRVLGGAMARVPVDATAFAHRQSRIMINVAAMYDPSTDERPEHAAWVHGLAGELDDGQPGAYAGLLDDEGEARVRAAYPGATWERLSALKAAYDRDNVFRLNQVGAPLLAGVVVGVELRVLRPLVGELVLGEAGVHGTCLDARVAVDALLRVDVKHLDRVVVRLVGGRVDAVDGADFDAGVVLGSDAGLGNDVSHVGNRDIGCCSRCFC